MAKERAGIYLAKQPEAFFYMLPKARQKRLARFLHQLRADLESSGGGGKQGLAFEWEPGFAVYWDVRLKPKYLESGVRVTTHGVAAKLGTAYRIEVLEIRKLS